MNAKGARLGSRPGFPVSAESRTKNPIMVNRPLPPMAAKSAHVAPDRHTGRQKPRRFEGQSPANGGPGREFAQILDKLYFFQLLENLHGICAKTSPPRKLRL